jgi:hypothetical protein
MARHLSARISSAPAGLDAFDRGAVVIETNDDPILAAGDR